MVWGKGATGRMEPIYPGDETLAILEEYLKSIPADREIKEEGLLHALMQQPHNYCRFLIIIKGIICSMTKKHRTNIIHRGG